MAAERGWHPARVQHGHHADIAAGFRLALTGAADGRIVNLARSLGFRATVASVYAAIREARL
jgi:hypothetical protein